MPGNLAKDGVEVGDKVRASAIERNFACLDQDAFSPGKDKIDAEGRYAADEGITGHPNCTTAGIVRRAAIARVGKTVGPGVRIDKPMVDKLLIGGR